MRLRVVLFALCAIACAERAIIPGRSAPVGWPPWSDEWITHEGQRFIHDTQYRRAALEASLTNPLNLYSRLRLGSYALGTRGWDLLPEWNPRSQRVTAPLATSLALGHTPAVSSARLWDEAIPDTMEAWVALGRRVFFEFPLRAEVTLEHGLTQPALAAAVGVERASDGALPGLVVFADVDGTTRVGITCAICHSAVRRGVVVAGAARRSFDYGKLRVAFHHDTGVPLERDQQQRMSQWGPGRADVTEDDDEDPVAIPDLWGLRAQTWLTQAGTIRHSSPLALAIRQETQLIDSNHQLVRPPRALVWALAMYLYSLVPPAVVRPQDPQQVLRGKGLFVNHCRRCHSNASLGGRTIAVGDIETHPGLANGRGRGTGAYRTAPLVDVLEGAPYLHDGSISSLAELLGSERLDSRYTAGRLGPGPIKGHRAGTELAIVDRAALIAYLETL